MDIAHSGRSVASTFILLPLLGMVGASIARGVAMAIGLVTLMIVLKRRISVGFDVEAFWKSFVSSGVMAAVVLLVQCCYYGKYLLPAYVVGGFVYFSMLFALRTIRPQDVQLLDEYLGPRFRFIVRPEKRLVANPWLGCAPPSAAEA